MSVSRRDFMCGASACALAAAVPLPFPVAASDFLAPCHSVGVWGGIFERAAGSYQGIIFREGVPWALGEMTQ
jgi:hypothetical protein